MIDTVHNYPGYLLGYVALFLGAFLWLEWRRAPSWVSWTAFAFFALPGLDYLWACLVLGTRFAIYNPP